jgi:hypothetical protein
MRYPHNHPAIHPFHLLFSYAHELVLSRSRQCCDSAALRCLQAEGAVGMWAGGQPAVPDQPCRARRCSSAVQGAAWYTGQPPPSRSVSLSLGLNHHLDSVHPAHNTGTGARLAGQPCASNAVQQPGLAVKQHNDAACRCRAAARHRQLLPALGGSASASLAWGLWGQGAFLAVQGAQTAK